MYNKVNPTVHRKKEEYTLDTSTVVSIAISLFSIIVSILFAITGIYFSNKSDKTLASIQGKIDAQNASFMTMIQGFMTMVQEERKTHDAQTDSHIQQMMEMMKISMQYILESNKADLPNEKAESLEKQLNEVFRMQKQYDSTSILSKRSKVEEKKTHA
jgi:hypothetical protein